MEASHHIPILFYFFALVALAIFFYNLRLLWTVRIGKEEKDRSTNWLGRFTNALTFGVGQRKVMSRRFTYASVMHFCLGWGFIELFFATTVDFFVTRGWFVAFLPAKDTPWFAALNDLGGVLLLVGLVLALLRRYLIKPEPLPQSGFAGRGNLFADTGILLFLLILVIGGFLAEAARLGIQEPPTAAFSFVGYPLARMASIETWAAVERGVWWAHAMTSLAFIALIPLTKMFHVVAVIANVALTDRPKQGLVRPMHVSQLMEDPEADFDAITLGAHQADEFTWKQLLDSVSCTECARCTAVCPAYATGRPLSPMKLITDIRQDLYDRTIRQKEAAEDLVGGRIQIDELWSCTTCGACINACPVLIDHVPTFTDMRRYLVLSEGQPPDKAAEALEGMTNRGNPWALAQGDRMKWASEAGLDLPIMSEKKKANVLYWVGCAGSYDPRNQKVARAFVKILQTAGVDFAVLGDEETCNGDSARRLGEEYLFETLAMQNIETLNQYEFNRIVTPCPHCMHTIGTEYRDFAGNYEVVHHSQFIGELIASGKLKLNGGGNGAGKVTFHDPCYLGRYHDQYESPRELIRQAVAAKGGFVEMEQARENSFCCGAGGGNMWYEMADETDRMNLNRVRQAAATGADTVATACSFCMIMMDDGVKVEGQEDSLQVKDVAELVADSL
jgi:Fe-S oxidoreductase